MCRIKTCLSNNKSAVNYNYYIYNLLAPKEFWKKLSPFAVI